MDIERSEKEIKKTGSLSEVNRKRILELKEWIEWQEAFNESDPTRYPITQEQENRVVLLKQRAQALLKRERLFEQTD
jgi:hypothetical protein